MSNYIVIDGDKIEFDDIFGERNVMPLQTSITIQGTGEANIEGKPICISGDEKKIVVTANYSTPAYSQTGTGIITIQALAADQIATFLHARPQVIIVGSQFTAQFQPNTPAINPSDSTPDPLASSPSQGSGRFINSQAFVVANNN